MTGRKCARCGREQPSWEVDGAIGPAGRGHLEDGAEGSLFSLLRAVWKKINDEDVCPDCQLATEREDIAARIVSAIENEITRSAGLDPSAVEPGLVTLAMQLREALASYEKSRSAEPSHDDRQGPTGAIPNDTIHEDPSRSAEPRQDEPKHSRRVPSRTCLDVAITGAFLTGCPLRVGLDNYAAVQQTLVDKLTENADQGWMARVEELREGSYDSGGGFSDQVPLVLACRGGDVALTRANEILNDRPNREHAWLKRESNGWTFTPRSIRIEVYDLGVAVINGTFDVDMHAELALDAAALMLKRLVWLRPDVPQVDSQHSMSDPLIDLRPVSSPITEMFRQLSEETTRQFQASVDATTMPELESWLPRTHQDKTDKDRSISPEWGRLLWLHPVHLVQIDDPKDGAHALAPTFSRTIKVPKGRFVSGVGWSAIVTLEKSAHALPLKLVHLHWAYFALYMEIDRGLLTVLDKRKTETKGATLAELEKDAKTVSDDYLRVMKARARVDSALAGLGGDEQAVWDVIADVQKFGALTGGVDRKVEVLQKIADRRVQQATTCAARRSTRILGLLTMFTLVTLATTILAYFFGGISDDLPDQHVGLRIGFLVAGVVVAFALWLVTFQLHPIRSWKNRKEGGPG